MSKRSSVIRNIATTCMESSNDRLVYASMQLPSFSLPIWDMKMIRTLTKPIKFPLGGYFSSYAFMCVPCPMLYKKNWHFYMRAVQNIYWTQFLAVWDIEGANVSYRRSLQVCIQQTCQLWQQYQAFRPSGPFLSLIPSWSSRQSSNAVSLRVVIPRKSFQAYIFHWSLYGRYSNLSRANCLEYSALLNALAALHSEAKLRLRPKIRWRIWMKQTSF